MKQKLTIIKSVLLFFVVTGSSAVFGLNNPFEEIKIGDQVWMDRNLDVIHFRNGDEIPHARTDREWRQAAERGEPAWCYYNNDPENGALYGRLYNWFAITDPRGIGMEGWRVPDDDDWKKLEMSLGMSSAQAEQLEWRGTDQGNQLRQEGVRLWRAPNAGANNRSGFTALPGGYRQPGGVFETIGVYGSWWTSTAFDDNNAYYRDLSASSPRVFRGAYPKGCGFSVRLVKAIGTDYQEPMELVDERDGNVYEIARIGNQVWMAENLRYLPQVHNNSGFRQAGNNSQPGFGVAGYNGSDLTRAKSHRNYNKYGVLYNWWAAIDGEQSSASNPSGVEGICPAGWHLPSDAEWTELIIYLGGENVAGKKIKSADGWQNNGNGTNSSSFNGLPGGLRYDDGRFDRIGGFAYWWSSTEYTTDEAWSRRLAYSDNDVSRYHPGKARGASVRCIKAELTSDYYRVHRPHSTDAEPDDESSTDVAEDLERPVGFVGEEPDTIPIPPDSLAVIEMPVHDVDQEGTPPGPSDDIGHGQQTGEPDTATEDHHNGQSFQSVWDVDGNEYKTTTIGMQIWMAENLRVSRFRNGDPIPLVSEGDDWEVINKQADPASSYYNNDPAYVEQFGKLYNWWTARDKRGVCPEGWRIPSRSDWKELVNYLGMEVAASKLKATSGWDVSQIGKNGNNQSGFNAKPGGQRSFSGFLGFSDINAVGNWWSATHVAGPVWRFRLNAWGTYYDLGFYSPNHGFSIRCIKDYH